ncbi:ORF6N domain-containing protein [Candidatus Woesearchaeota archaeon]|nr:ORF6N domain-containing protein [Candidatus Woesearchaeota archaeon]
MTNIIISDNNIKDKIHTLRGVEVMLDRDLAQLYQVETKRLNEQVKRNIKRFPKDFMFQLTEIEQNELVAKCDHLKNLKYSYQNSYVFTEQGVATLSGILKSDKAIEVNILIMRAFVSMRKFISQNIKLFDKFDQVDKKLLEHDKNFDKIFDAIELKLPKTQGIFFDGQMFEARKFVCDLIKTAKKEIILIDNYVDCSVLDLFSDREVGAKVIIYTKNLSSKLKKDLELFNAKFQHIEIKKFDKSHDRFMIIDSVTYHFGASLKDLGKKWFAFNKLTGIDILSRLN